MKLNFLKTFLSRFRKNIILLVVLSSGIILTLSIFFIIKNKNHNEMRERFINYSLARYKLIANQFDKSFADAAVIANFFRSSVKVEKDEFNTFVDPMLFRSGDSGVGFIWIPYVTKNEKLNFEREAGKDYKIWSRDKNKNRIDAADKEYYLPILYIEPIETFKSWLGIEMSSDSTAYESMLKLFDGKLDRTVDIQEFSDSVESNSALRIYFPVFSSDSKVSGLSQHKKLKGIVLAWYGVNKQIKMLFNDTPSFEINFDITAIYPNGDKKALFSHHPEGIKELNFIERVLNDNYELHISNEYVFKEMIFRFDFSGSADFIRNNASYAHWALLAFGLALNIMLFIITYRLLYRKERAEALVLERTKELRQSERTARALLNASPDIILLLGLDGSIWGCNDASISSLRQNENDIWGKNYFDLIDENLAAERRAAFEKSAASATPVHFEDEFLSYWCDCTFFPIEDDSGEITRIAFFSHNITERKNNEKREREYSKRIEKISDLEKLIILKRQPERIYPFFFSTLEEFYNPDIIAIALFENENRTVDVLSRKKQERKSGFENVKVDYEEFVSIGLNNSPGAFIRNYSGVSDSAGKFWNKYFAMGIASLVSIPIQIGQNISGFIVLMNKAPKSYSIGNVAFAQDMTATLAIALEQYNLIEQNKKYALELENKVKTRTEQLERVNKELEAFSYSVSHDLRAPLRVIDGYSRVLSEDYRNSLDDAAKQHLDKILHSTSKMGTLIEDLLKLSRISRLTLVKGEVNLSGIIEEIAEDLKKSDPDRISEIEILPSQTVYGDYGLLKIAMENLMGNAWKFTSKKDKTSIKFGLLDVDKEKYYFISDNGAGFDMNYSDRLFGAFQRLHTTEEFPGTGIGLSIVQRIVARHNGRIWAESKIDAGSTFYFSIS